VDDGTAGGVGWELIADRHEQPFIERTTVMVVLSAYAPGSIVAIISEISYNTVMNIEILANKLEIERWLRIDAALHLYELGDLDDFFWPHTKWFGLRRSGSLNALALLYAGTGLPVLLALASKEQASLSELLTQIRAALPERFYCHLSPGLELALRPAFALESHGQHCKMVLKRTDERNAIDTGDAVALGEHDLEELHAFYCQSYPGNWFDPRMLKTEQYFGIRIDGTLASVAGVHVYSPRYRVAGLGNIATHPKYRGMGLGTRVTAALCRQLSRSADIIGLNVKADNAAAIACYRRLGFVQNADYNEWMAQRVR
jgi:GNAT superfamily N-acetyltransferase